MIPDPILAISCTYPPYRVAWEINRVLGVTLSQALDLQFNESASFKVFQNSKDDIGIIKLIENKTETGRLSTKYKNIDYFLIANGQEYRKVIRDFKIRLHRSQLIQGTFEISPDKLLAKAIMLMVV